MIVQWFAELLFKLLTGLLNGIHLPNLPQDVMNTIIEFLGLFSDTSYALYRAFVPSNVIKVGLPILIAVSAFKYIYYFVMWILKKIPAFGIN